MSIFRSNKDIEFIIKINQELIEKVIGEKVTYYPISKKFSEVNFYNESRKKIFDPPVEVYALVNWKDQDVKTSKFGQDVVYNLDVSILKKHLLDINLEPTEGDMIEYDDVKFEITSITSPMQIFGKAGHDIGYLLKCRSVRQGSFDSVISGVIDQPKRTYPDEPMSSSFYYSSTNYPYSGSGV